MGGEVENSRGYWLLLAAFSRGLRERGTQAGGRQLARGGGGGVGGWGGGWMGILFCRGQDSVSAA